MNPSTIFIALLVSTAFGLWLAEDIIARHQGLITLLPLARTAYMLGGVGLILFGLSAISVN